MQLHPYSDASHTQCPEWRGRKGRKGEERNEKQGKGRIEKKQNAFLKIKNAP